jgi:hypothetical protein
MNRSSLERQFLEDRADAIFKASEGLGTDEAGIFRSLSGLNEGQRKQLDQIYQQKYGKTLEQQVREEMSGPDLDKALSLLRGKEQTLDFRADEIHRASQGLGTDEAAIFRNLSGLSPSQLKELDTLYQQKYGMTLEQQVRAEMSGPDLDKALSLLHGKGSSHQDPVHRNDGKGSRKSTNRTPSQTLSFFALEAPGRRWNSYRNRSMNGACKTGYRKSLLMESSGRRQNARSKSFNNRSESPQTA